MQPDVLADVIVQTVKAALAPMQERLAAAETRVALASANEQIIVELRERIVTLETKQAAPVTTAEVVDLAPVLQRVAASEARLEVLGDLRDRVVIIETKAAAPVAVLESQPNHSAPELRDRLVALETRMAEPTNDPAVPELRERVAALEAKSVLPFTVPVPPSPDLGDVTDRITTCESKAVELRDRLVALETKPVPPVDLGDVPTRLSAAELRLEVDAAERRPLVASLSDATKDLGALRERVAVLEVRAPIPGPPGDDGLGFDDLDFVYDEYGRLSLKFVRGDVVKHARVPGIVDRGVYESGEVYLKGDGATFGNSFWIAQRDTSAKPGEEPGAWRLSVRAGRDGRDARHKPDLPALPVVKS